jgi:hypothetical protein
VSDQVAYFSQAVQRGVFGEALGAALSRYDGSMAINVLLLLFMTGVGVFYVFRAASTQRTQLQNESTAVEPPA